MSILPFSTISTYDAAAGGSAFDVGSFLLSAGHFVGVFAGSFAMGLAYTVITALISFPRLMIVGRRQRDAPPLIGTDRRESKGFAVLPGNCFGISGSLIRLRSTFWHP